MKAVVHALLLAVGVAILLGQDQLRGDSGTFYLSSETFLTESTGNRIEVLCDHDFDIMGLSFGVNYDESLLAVTDVTNAGTDSEIADFFSGRIDTANGLVGYGCVFDLAGDFSTKRLPAGVNHAIAVLVTEVIATGEAATEVRLEDVATTPNPNRPVTNVMTNELGQSVYPTRQNGEVTIVTGAPEIVSLENNGGLEGQVFQILGNYLDQPGLEVTVCGTVAQATPREGGGTVDVMAPACGEVGYAVVEICTDRGCDSIAEGFLYEEPPTPVILDISPSQGPAGTQFTITGENLGAPGLEILVCNEPAVHAPPPNGDGTAVLVTAPPGTPCDPGPADVEVRTVFGSAVAAGGFTYRPLVDFVRGDVNSDGNLDISDAVFGLLYLFTGGAVPPCHKSADSDDSGVVDVTDSILLLDAIFLAGPAPEDPFPECGSDPTDDGLSCDSYLPCQ